MRESFSQINQFLEIDQQSILGRKVLWVKKWVIGKLNFLWVASFYE